MPIYKVAKHKKGKGRNTFRCDLQVFICYGKEFKNEDGKIAIHKHNKRRLCSFCSNLPENIRCQYGSVQLCTFTGNGDSFNAHMKKQHPNQKPINTLLTIKTNKINSYFKPINVNSINSNNENINIDNENTNIDNQNININNRNINVDRQNVNIDNENFH